MALIIHLDRPPTDEAKLGRWAGPNHSDAFRSPSGYDAPAAQGTVWAWPHQLVVCKLICWTAQTAYSGERDR